MASPSGPLVQLASDYPSGPSGLAGPLSGTPGPSLSVPNPVPYVDPRSSPDAGLPAYARAAPSGSADRGVSVISPSSAPASASPSPMASPAVNPPASVVPTVDAPAAPALVPARAPATQSAGRTIMYVAVGVLVLAIVAVGVATWWTVDSLSPELSGVQRRCAVHATVTTGVMSMVILAWPMLFHAFLGLNTLTRYPVAALGFGWPILLCVSDILSRKDSPSIFDPDLRGSLKEEDMRGGPSDFSDSKLGAEALSITTLIFAMGTLFVHTLSKRQMAYTVPALKWALLLGIAFVIPDTYQDPGSVAGAAIQALKKSAFNMAVGMVITGIVLDLAFTSRRREALTPAIMEADAVTPIGPGRGSIADLS